MSDENNTPVPGTDTPAAAPTPGAPAASVNDASVQADAARLAAMANTPDPAAQAAAAQAADAAAAIREQTVGVFKGCLAPTFGFVAPNWKVPANEVEMLAEAYADCLLHYYPDGFAAIGPALGAVMATIVVFGPRLQTPLREEPPAEKPVEAAPAAA